MSMSMVELVRSAFIRSRLVLDCVFFFRRCHFKERRKRYHPIIMANQIPKTQILSIYKQLLRESQKFDTYNFRMYALRRVRDAFKENKNTTDVPQQYKFAKENLELIKRQVIVGKLYSTDKLVIETASK